ncbi:MAG: multimodular transpeptidase-transglycosylase [Ktedonobacterales bacterium]|nr:MAG: multimodular transpeptidase-transglycosylase [Ktedonobacterales bacterium]
MDTTGSTSSFESQEPEQRDDNAQPVSDQQGREDAQDHAQDQDQAQDLAAQTSHETDAHSSPSTDEPAASPDEVPTVIEPAVSPDEIPTVIEHSVRANDGVSDGASATAAAHNGASDAVAPLSPPLPVADAGDWAVAASPSLPGAALGRIPLTPEARRFQRRRRHYTLFVRRGARARQATRAATFARAAWATAALLLLLIVTVSTATFGAAASYYQSEIQQINGLRQEVTSQDSMRIYDSKGTLLYELRDNGFQHSISIAHIPITVINATTAIEDKDFWVNNGVDYTSIIRAALANYQQGDVTQGGSSITQQLIKQQLLHDNSTDYVRKLREAILSIGITTQGTYSKQAILELYLNSIGYSDTAYGIDAAAQYYFNYTDDPSTGMTAAQHLDLAQASMLAGVPQNPDLNDPLKHFDVARQRQSLVLNAMIANGYITKAQAEAAWEEAGQPNFFHPARQNPNLAPHFVNYVIQQLAQMVGNGQLNLSRSGLNVYTTLDLDLENQVQKIAQTHISSCSEKTGYAGYVMCEAHATNAAAVLADQHNGDIKVLMGSVNYNSTKFDGQFDVATQGYRGPGSSMKPIVYATAFEKGWFPAMTISDMPTAFYIGPGIPPYKPLDYTKNEFAGEITLRTALQWSLNIPAIKVMQFAGLQDVGTNLKRMGVRDWNNDLVLSSVLGTLEVHPIDMVQAYTVFANYGKYIPLHAINSITDSNGNVLFQYHVPQPVQVMDPRIAFLITNILSDNASRAGDFGGCSFLYLDPYNDPNNPGYECAQMRRHNWSSPNAWPAAAKTGTGSDFTDDWTMGYTMNYTMGVWVGNNDHSPMVHVDGVHGAAPIWNRSMLYALNGQPKIQFPVPSGVYRATYTSNGVTSTDWFLKGNTLPPNSGSGGPASIPCIVEPDSGGWEYSSPPNCVGVPKKG